MLSNRVINPTQMDDNDEEMMLTAKVLIVQNEIIKDEAMFVTSYGTVTFTNTIRRVENNIYMVWNDEGNAIGTIVIVDKMAIYSGQKYQTNEDEKNISQGTQGSSKENINEFQNKKLKDSKENSSKKHKKHFHFSKLFSLKNNNKSKEKSRVQSIPVKPYDDYEVESIETKQRCELNGAELEKEQLQDLQELENYANRLLTEIKSQRYEFFNTTVLIDLLELIGTEIPDIIQILKAIKYDVFKAKTSGYFSEIEDIRYCKNELIDIEEQWTKYKLINILDAIFVFNNKFKREKDNILCRDLVVSLLKNITEENFKNKKTEEIFEILSAHIKDFRFKKIEDDRNFEEMDEYPDYNSFSENLIDYLMVKYSRYEVEVEIEPKTETTSTVTMKM